MDNLLKLNITGAAPEASREAVEKLLPEADQCLQQVLKGTGEGNDFLGWVDLPQRAIDAEGGAFLGRLQEVARDLRERCEVIVVVGIGGSYLGAKAVVEALGDSFAPLRGEGDDKRTRVLFAGQNIGEDYLWELQDLLRGRSFGIIVISKSGTTTEPAIAFRLLKGQLEAQVGRAEAARRIVAVTDAKRGALRRLADQEGYRTFVIDDNVGGRFSVLTPVGLLPIAAAGHDIRALVEGAADMERHTWQPDDTNPSLLYAATRNALYRAGKKTELLVNFNPKLHYLGEWWKQLYGESEGKEGKGIFPAAADFTTDLHSMGQWIQQGERTIFETVVTVEAPERTLAIPQDKENLDGLNFLSGKRVDQVNKMAELGTRLAHRDGGVPQIVVSIPRLDERSLGALIYFFEKACGISGYMLGVNPFNQPGVEAYKRNMFALLDKPGYEAESAAIKKRL